MPAWILILTLLGAVPTILSIRKLVKNPKIEFEQAIKKAALYFSSDILKNCERIYRLESAHFKSNQFKVTYSPGMEAFGKIFPWGWNTLASILWNERRDLAPFTLKTFTENKTGKKKTFLVFPSMFAAVMTVCTFLKKYNNNPGRWYSLDPDSQNKYNRSIYAINPSIVNALLANGKI